MRFSSEAFLSEKDVAVVIPTESLRQTAQQFSQRHPAHAKRIYCNTLAVGVVDQYLRLLGIETDVTQGDSWHPVLQVVNDVADLYLPGQGRIECRVVEADETVCHVPADASCDRIAYIVIRLHLEPAEPEAALLGFVPEITDEWILLSELRNLSELPQHLKEASTRQDHP